MRTRYSFSLDLEKGDNYTREKQRIVLNALTLARVISESKWVYTYYVDHSRNGKTGIETDILDLLFNNGGASVLNVTVTLED